MNQTKKHRIMDLGAEMRKLFPGTAQIGSVLLLLLWYTLHLIVSMWYFAMGVTHVLESNLISSGLLKSFKTLDLDKLQNLAVVVDSEEARQTSKVIELVRGLASIGVKNVCLYDAEGLLKKSKEVIVKGSRVAKLSEDATKSDLLLGKKHIHLDFASFSDGKEAVVKAANLLYVKHYLNGDQKESIFTESHIADALRAVGSGGPDLDLLLVYGPVRCHLGFPPSRIRYTEIAYMGSLKSMKYGSLLKAIQKFTTVKQNYGK